MTEGGPGGLRRSFRVFDRNGDGSIDHREFDKVLRRYLNLRFDKRLIEKVMVQFDDTGDGRVNFRKFSELVVGSNNRSQTSLTVGASQIKGRSNVVSDDAGNSDMMVRRKINMSYKALRASFRDLVDNKGKISREDLIWVLSRYDIDLVPVRNRLSLSLSLCLSLSLSLAYILCELSVVCDLRYRVYRTS